MRFLSLEVEFVGFLNERGKEFIGWRGCSTGYSSSKPDPVNLRGSSGGPGRTGSRPGLHPEARLGIFLPGVRSSYSVLPAPRPVSPLHLVPWMLCNEQRVTL